VPRLIMLNGSPAMGKSTLALRFVADHPLALCLDVDRVRGLLGRWDEHASEAGRLARTMALAMATVHLLAGRDVIVPQLLGRTDFLERLEQTAVDTGSAFYEVVLSDTLPNALARFAARADDPALREHHRLAEHLAGGVAGVTAMYERVHDVARTRPRTRVLTTAAGDVEGAYRQLLAALDTPPGDHGGMVGTGPPQPTESP
jgi:predicted kinase